MSARARFWFVAQLVAVLVGIYGGRELFRIVTT